MESGRILSWFMPSRVLRPVSADNDRTQLDSYLNYLSYLLVVYQIVLVVIAVKAVNQFGWGRAVGSGLLPALLALLGPQISSAILQ